MVVALRERERESNLKINLYGQTGWICRENKIHTHNVHLKIRFYFLFFKLSKQVTNQINDETKKNLKVDLYGQTGWICRGEKYSYTMSI